MFHLAETLRKISIMLVPFIPETAEEIQKQLGFEKNVEWESIKKEIIKENTRVTEQGKPIFVRLEKEEEINYIKEEMAKTKKQIIKHIIKV